MQNIRRNQAVFQRNRQNTKKKQFEKFQATELYCPICRKAMPVRERLLLVLPEGEKFEYPVCTMRRIFGRQDCERRNEAVGNNLGIISAC